MKKFIVSICVIILAAGCFNWHKQTDEQAQGGQTLKNGSRRETPVVDAVKMIKNSVVNIRTEKIIPKAELRPADGIHNSNYFDDFMGHSKAYKTQSLGSGFIVKDNGIIITNYHVIASASKIYVMLSDNSTYEAELVGGDNIIDIAILKIKNAKGRKFPIAKLGNSDNIMLGETVVAMGDPYGLSSSVTTGVVSSVKRILKIGLGYSEFIQTDALINPGNSGGPLVNLDGDVIGINSAMVQEAQGICFSIPINTAIRVMPEILKTHKISTGYVGISAQEAAGRDGSVSLRIVKVEKDSNADKIGLRPGDIILQINDTPISTLIAMSNMLRSYPAGSSISVIVQRGKKTLKGRILLASYPDNYGMKVLQSDYGLTFTPVDGAEVITASKYPDIFHHGDVLTAINDKQIKSDKDINTEIMNNLGRVITLTINRGGLAIKLKIQI